MTVVSREMAAADAQMLWLSAKVPNDQFLLYVFDGSPDVPAAVEELRRNVGRCEDLTLRVRDEHPWRYPVWEDTGVAPEQFVVHPAVAQWRDCLAALPGLEPLDVTRMAWRAHVFPAGAKCVVVVQISHALGDGTRSAALAAALLGRRSAVPAVAEPERGFLPWRAFQAARAHRGVPAPVPPRPLCSVNARPGATPVLRTLVVDRAALRTPTVSVAALSAIAEALGGYLGARGEDVSRLGAEVPMAGPPNGDARNNFRNVSIDLHPELDRAERTVRIAAELDAARRRGGHPAVAASAAAFAAVPAPLLRWGVGRFDPSARSPSVAAHTVVSSVNRGPADLSFGGCPVLLTAGFPALSPMMSLTHGVHGIGDAIAVSVHADPVNVDVDEYLDRLGRALDQAPGRP